MVLLSPIHNTRLHAVNTRFHTQRAIKSDKDRNGDSSLDLDLSEAHIVLTVMPRTKDGLGRVIRFDRHRQPAAPKG